MYLHASITYYGHVMYDRYALLHPPDPSALQFERLEKRRIKSSKFSFKPLEGKSLAYPDPFFSKELDA